LKGWRKCLNLSLFIHTEDQFTLFLKELSTLVVPQNRCRFLLDVGSDGVFPIKHAVGLQVDMLKDQPDRGIMDLREDPVLDDLGLNATAIPTLQPETMLGGRTTGQGEDLCGLQRGKYGCSCPLAVRPEEPSVRVVYSVGRPARWWCGHGRYAPRLGRDSGPHGTTAGYAPGQPPAIRSYRSAGTSPGLRCVRYTGQLGWVWVPGK